MAFTLRCGLTVFSDECDQACGKVYDVCILRRWSDSAGYILRKTV